MKTDLCTADRSTLTIVPVQGRITLPHGETMFPTWQVSHPDYRVFGGWVNADSVVAVQIGNTILEYRAGIDFPVGSFIAPYKVDTDDLQLKISSFIFPGLTCRVDSHSKKLDHLSTSKYDFTTPAQYKRVYATSNDGTQVPIDCFGSFDYPSPTFVHVYGGFGKSNISFFSPDIAQF